MAILLQCFSIVIPIAKLKKSDKIPDVDEFIRKHGNVLSSCCFDRYLYCYPAGMNSMDVMFALDSFESQGFVLTRRYKGVMHWQDVCVVDACDGPTMPCRWLEFDAEQGIVWYKGTDPGEVVATGRDSELYSKDGYLIE